MVANPLVLAASDPEAVQRLLKEDAAIAAKQDESGYSLLHAAASYGHLQLLRDLVEKYDVDVDLVDEDGETCLFVAEQLDVVKCLVEELQIDISIENEEGQTARQKFEEDDDIPDEIQGYLKRQENIAAGGKPDNEPKKPDVKFTAVEPSSLPDDDVVDPDLKRRIEELVEKGNVESDEGQQQFRDLVADVVKVHITESLDRDRPRKAHDRPDPT